MRCFFIRDGHVAGVEILRPGDDEDLIKQGWAVFNAHPKKASFQGFQVWDLARRVYSSSQEDQSDAVRGEDRQTGTGGR